MANFYRLLIPKFAQLTKPLTRLTCKGVWTGGELPKCAKEAFKKCQALFTERPFLHYPDFNLKFHLYVDASLGDLDEAKEGGLAGCLVQYPNNNVDAKCKPIGFCSRGLQKHEKNYSAHLIETAGIIFAIEFFEKYLRTKFVCHTDHKPITTVKEGKVHKRTLERFREILAHYDFTLEYTPGEKMPSDFMSRHAKVDSLTLIKHAKINSITLNCTELYSMLEEKNEKISETKPVEPEKIQFQTAENKAACNACTTTHTEIKVCRPASSAKELEREEPSRSDLVVQKKEPPQIELYERAKKCWARAQEAAVQALRAEECAQSSRPKKLLTEPKRELNECAENGDSVELSQQKGAVQIAAKSGLVHGGVAGLVRNEGTEMAPRKTLKDKIVETTSQMANLAKFSVYGVKGKILSFNFYDTSVDKNPVLLKQQQSIDPFVQAIKYFITDKILPKQRNRDIIKRWGPYCFEKKGVIMIKYARQGFPTRDLIVAPAERISNIIAEAHGSLLGGHDSTEKTAQRILTTYWFPGVFSETDFFIENCSICQRNKKKSKVSNTYLKPLKQADQVFERVHLDLFGPMKTENNKSYICTMVDSFSKFAIFKVIPSKDAETVAKCFFDNWITIFGSPLSIVTDGHRFQY
jgi:hypothetical protein